jgi:hypothetical protein
MWNTLAYVADNHRLDKNAFIDFAMRNKIRYGLDDQNMIGTWHVNDLIRDFREIMGRLADPNLPALPYASIRREAKRR